MEFGFAEIPAIATICFLIGMTVKASPIDDKWIPITCALFGGVLGVLSMIAMPDFSASDPVTALAVGIASGLSATGVHQVYRQLVKAE